jgi:hypothetical protein
MTVTDADGSPGRDESSQADNNPKTKTRAMKMTGTRGMDLP